MSQTVWSLIEFYEDDGALIPTTITDKVFRSKEDAIVELKQHVKGRVMKLCKCSQDDVSFDEKSNHTFDDDGEPLFLEYSLIAHGIVKSSGRKFRGNLYTVKQYQIS